MNFLSFFEKFKVEAAIIIGFVMLVAIATTFSASRHSRLDQQVPDPSSPKLSPTLNGLQRDAGKAALSLDAAAQGNESVVLAGKNATVPLPFSRDSAISFVGWAADGAQPAKGVYLVIDGSKRLPALYGFARPDVAEALGAPNAHDVGFQVDIPPHTFGAGSHKLYVLVIDRDDKGYYLAGAQATVRFDK